MYVPLDRFYTNAESTNCKLEFFYFFLHKRKAKKLMNLTVIPFTNAIPTMAKKLKIAPYPYKNKFCNNTKVDVKINLKILYLRELNTQSQSIQYVQYFNVTLNQLFVQKQHYNYLKIIILHKNSKVK